MKRVAVLRGGPSEEYDVSMLTGRAVLDALDAADYPYRDITISKAGDWLEQGRKRRPEQALEGVDVVFLALHGTFGEDGQVQRMLERFNIPFTGSPSLASGLALNKELAKQTAHSNGVHTPRHRRVGQFEKQHVNQELEQIIMDLGTELYIKPLYARSPESYRSVSEAAALEANLKEMLDLYDDVLVETAVAGTAVHVGVLEDFRGEAMYTFPVHEAKDRTFQVSSLPESIKSKLSEIAKLVHTGVGCSQYSMCDFIVQNQDVYFLNIDTHPLLLADSHYIGSANSIGLGFTDFVTHVINTAK